MNDPAPLDRQELERIDAYWRAANYLSVGQIYLLDNPLLREPLKREHIKPRLLGHWGTSPGLNMLCVHLNRVIKRDDLNVIYVIGPGHGGPSMVAHAYGPGGVKREIEVTIARTDTTEIERGYTGQRGQDEQNRRARKAAVQTPGKALTSQSLGVTSDAGFQKPTP